MLLFGNRLEPFGNFYVLLFKSCAFERNCNDGLGDKNFLILEVHVQRSTFVGWKWSLEVSLS